MLGEELGWAGHGEIRHTWRRRHQTHSVSKHSLRTYYAPGVLSGAGVTAVDKAARAPRGAWIPAEKAGDREGGRYINTPKLDSVF